MKKWKRVAMAATAAVIASSMAFSLAACGDEGEPRMTTKPVTTAEEFAAYTEESGEIYDEQLGDFYDAYMVAKEAENESERYALMAVAEAKLLESAVMMPTQTDGGNYAISRVAPNTVDYSLWGNDNVRYHQALVTNELITAEHREEMRTHWNEMRAAGTYDGDDYSAWAREYLSGKGYTFSTTYDMGYASDPETWDVLATSQATDSDVLVNTYDGLVEYDELGILQPALAESWDVSDDGLTYTFHLRDDATWVTAQGQHYEDVVADDFVAGFQHMLDAAGGLEYLVEGIIENASEYLAGTVSDFSQVGVTAVDEHTLQYTLEAPCSYFMTMLGYGVFAPMNRAYFTSHGGAFGEDYDPSYGGASNAYGTDRNNILYCGPYTVTSYTANNSIVFSSNPEYYNRDHINVTTINWLYNDSQDPLKAYNDTISGVLDGAGLTNSALVRAKADIVPGTNESYLDMYGYVSSTSTTTYSMFYNINRYAFEDIYDGNAASSQTVSQAETTKAAMQNVHFRRAISFAFNREAYNAVTVGAEVALNSLRNTYTPGTFIMLEENVTISINGTQTTFEAGTYYGEIIQAQLNADEVPIKAWNTEVEDSISGVMGSSDGYDGWYNVENAVAELEIAIEELAEDGIEISADNPVQIDYICYDASSTYAARGNAYKQSLETALNGCVKVNLISASLYEWYYSCYFNTYGHQSNYDANDLSGWGPDYGDPATYLDTFLPDYAGYVVKSIGLF